MLKRAFFASMLAVAGFAFAAPEAVVASKFGFDETDATKCLQAALDSGAAKVIVDNPGKPWIVTPISLRSNQEVILQDGVVIQAKSGAFKSRVECLMNIVGIQNVILRGEGAATLRMNKKDYMDESKYDWAEWRHTVNIAGATNVQVRNLTLKSSGGDGVYIRAVSKNVLLENLVCLDHHRQGISIISVDGLMVRNCTFNETWGTAPMCGLDIEPNTPRDICRNIVFENCVFDKNRSAGVCLHLLPLDQTSAPIDATFRKCKIRDNQGYGFAINAHNGEPYKGTVRLEDCEFQRNAVGVLNIGAMHRDGVKLHFKNCQFDNSGCKTPAITLGIGSSPDDVSNISFEACRLLPGTGDNILFVGRTGFGIHDIHGDVTLPDGTKLDFEQLKKDYKPQPELRKFEVAKLETKALKPFGGNAAEDADNRIFIRYGFNFLQYFPAAGEYPIHFIIRPYNTRKPEANVKILDTNGNEYGKFSFSDLDFTYKFKARGAGVYTFHVSTNQAAAVESPTPGNGIDVSDWLNLFRGSKHKLYFVVPAGAQEVYVDLKGGGTGEWLDAVLLDAKGEVKNSVSKLTGGAILKGTRPANAPAEVWCVSMTNVVEDHFIRIGAPCIPVFSNNPNMLFIGK